MTPQDFEILAASIRARNALSEHKCAKHPAWCPAHDIGCEEAARLHEEDMSCWEAADEVLKRLGVAV